MKTTLFCIFIGFLCVMSLSAAYLTDVSQEITQPDGSILHCYASGDEFHNWLHDSKNYTIIQDPQTGYYTYAQKIGDKLESSQYIVGITNPEMTNLVPGLNIDREEYIQKRQSWDDNRSIVSRAPTSGVINNVVVFIRFSDQTEFTNSLSTYNSMFNNTTPNTNSMYNYFMEDSYQALSINTTFYPFPLNHIVVSFQDSLPRNYYMPYSTSNPIGYNDSTDRRIREHTLLVNAIQYVSTMIPPSLELDSDDDGRADNVCFIVKGSSGAWANLLWPHKWSLYTYEAFLNGVRVYTYNFQLENSLSSSGVGVLCHEMSHSIGFPDLYHYTSNGITPIGRWDLMESNRNPPQHHTAYLKSRYGNWLPPMREITQPGTYWVNKMLIQQNNCYKIASNNPQYYYVVEFRKQEGFFEPSIQGTGLLVYRVDTSEDGDGNADGPPDELYVYRPNGTISVNGTISSAHFSQEVGRTSINAASNPTPFLGDGLQGGLNITQIGSSAGDSISFNVSLPAPAPKDYDEGFESGDYSSYNWVLSGDSLWTIDNNIKYQGLYSAKSGHIDHNQTNAISLNINIPVAGYIAFYKKTSSESDCDYLRFYIDDIQKGQWAGSSNWSYVQFPVTPGNHVLKWSYSKDNGTVSGSDCVWIDNILFKWNAPDIHLVPQNYQALSLTDDIGIRLDWQPPLQMTASLSGYRIFKDNIQIADIDSSQLSYTDYNVYPNTAYSYYIKAFYANPHGHSIASDTLDIVVSGIPVIPALVSALVIDTFSVSLQWMIPVINRGIIGYDIYRNGEMVHSIDDASVMQWTDARLECGRYIYQIASRYLTCSSGLSDYLTVNIENNVSDSELITTPIVFGFGDIYPNPFRNILQINYNIDKNNIPIDISIYNVKGQKIKNLLQITSGKGTYKIEWNGRDNEGLQVASGIYFCKMQSNSRSSFRKVILFK